MIRQATVVGISKRSGVSSASGKPYQFYQAHFAYDDESVVEGLCTISVIVSDSVVHRLSINGFYEVDIAWNEKKQPYLRSIFRADPAGA